MYKIKKENLTALFRAIAAEQELYVPVKSAGKVNFGTWSEDAEVDIDTLKSVKSPKDIFFPQSENLYTCEREGRKLKVEPEALKEQKFTVFGMRACDVQGVKVLDQVFLAEPVAWFAGEELYWKALTEKGELLTEQVKVLLTEADASEEQKIEQEKNNIREIVEKLPYTHLSLEGWDGNATEKRFDSPLWEELYKPCLACGTCTFVCPTCQCYDIKDYDTGHGVKRFRCWDSCMYSDFTMMAHGNNRTSQMQRFRQRFMHKLVYFPANNNGMYSCVGCGRCVEKCPSALNIVKVIKAFEKEGGEKA